MKSQWISGKLKSCKSSLKLSRRKQKIKSTSAFQLINQVIFRYSGTLPEPQSFTLCSHRSLINQTKSQLFNRQLSKWHVNAASHIIKQGFIPQWEWDCKSFSVIPPQSYQSDLCIHEREREWKVDGVDLQDHSGEGLELIVDKLMKSYNVCTISNCNQIG